jgi:hypothetical protein
VELKEIKSKIKYEIMLHGFLTEASLYDCLNLTEDYKPEVPAIKRALVELIDSNLIRTKSYGDSYILFSLNNKEC